MTTPKKLALYDISAVEEAWLLKEIKFNKNEGTIQKHFWHSNVGKGKNQIKELTSAGKDDDPTVWAAMEKALEWHKACQQQACK